MSAVASTPFPAVRWDLSAFFSGREDPRIEETWAAAHAAADRFAEQYREVISDPTLDGPTLLASIREYERIYNEASKPVVYANLIFACDSADPAVGAFLAEQSERSSELAVKLIFFGLALQDLDDQVVARALASTPELENYRHFLEVSRKYRPHKLSEAEEVILEEVANTGSRAWVRLHEELLANHVFTFVNPDGTTEELSEPEVLARLRHPDRAIRQAAGDALTAGLAQLQRPLTFIYNTLLQDKKVEDRLRAHPYAEHSRHLSNEVDKEVVDLVVGKCGDHYGLVSRFYRIKREILGLETLTHIDRYAPLAESEQVVSFEEGRDLVLGALGEFSPKISELAGEFFERNWIDAEPRTGKQGGAFCSSNTPDLHPVVFMNYQNKPDDVMTLAHELGHGVHASLSRKQTLLNFHTTLTLAEMASTFAEMLVFERLVREANPKDQLALYAEKIESIFATVFRQAAMFRFEQRVHTLRREEGELSPEEFGEVWQEEQQAMFGDSVTLGEQHKTWWSYVPHFIGSPFYVYAYSFGELLVLALYEQAKAQGPAFAEKYEAVLAAGGSLSPTQIMEMVDVDLRDPAFWQGAFDVLGRLVDKFESLWAEAR